MAHERISERVRDVGDGLILAFPISDVEVGTERLETVRLYFFRVAAETRYFQKYTQLANITSGSTTPTTGYGYLGDTGVDTGDDIFRVETDDWHLQHFGVATVHPDLEFFFTVSPKANGDPAQDRTGTGEDIVPGTDDRGWFSSAMQDDRFDPRAATERVAFRNGSNQDGQYLLWAFHNDGSATLSGTQLHLYFTGRGYKTQPVTDRATQDLMLEMAMSRPDEPAIDTIIHNVGGITQYQFGSEEPTSWGRVDDMQREFSVEDFPVIDRDRRRQTTTVG